jgi:hypothetical protein
VPYFQSSGLSTRNKVNSREDIEAFRSLMHGWIWEFDMLILFTPNFSSRNRTETRHCQNPLRLHVSHNIIYTHIFIHIYLYIYIYIYIYIYMIKKDPLMSTWPNSILSITRCHLCFYRKLKKQFSIITFIIILNFIVLFQYH